MAVLGKKAAEMMTPLYCEVRVIMPSGEERWKLLSSSPRLLDNGHKIWDGIDIDITDKKNAELALKDSEEKFRTLYEESNDAIYLMEGDTFINCNPSAVRIFGCDNQTDLIGHKPTDFSPDSQPDGSLSTESAIAHINQALAGNHQRFYWKHCRKDRSDFDAEVSLDRLIIKGKTYLQAIVIDITYRIEAENQSKKMNEILEQKVQDRTAQLKLANQELESFSYSVSHDLRAPVRHIMGFTELLKKEFLEEQNGRIEDHLDKIILSATKMEELIDDLLNFSRTSTRELNREKIDMNRIVKDAVKEVTHNSYTFSIEWKIGDLPQVQADRNLMQSVWMNLIDNAIKYTKKIEKPLIEIGFSDRGKEYEFFIKDNGVGFDIEYSHKLFGVFQRLHLEKDYPGTGIGLANVKK
jgi:PAS domain S-box-containing protein